EANRRIRAAQLAKETAWIWYDKHLRPLRAVAMEKAIMLMAPVEKRILMPPVKVIGVRQRLTVYQGMKDSLVQPALISMPMRRILRPRGRLVRSLSFRRGIQPENLLARINIGKVSAAPPKEKPPGVLTLQDAT